MSLENGTKEAKFVYHNTNEWLKQNREHFKPPVCNYLMHGAGRLKVMYVGGPNIRKDFHLQEGEEFFYMIKGDMNLIILENGKFRDVIIKEGEAFHLPGKIPHSPQRFADTMGLVIERERMLQEQDCVRYFVGDTTETLYEEWFYCEDLGTQLGPVIKRYFASEQHKTGKPIPGTITETPPFVPDSERFTEKPFHLRTWIKENLAKLESAGRLRLWDTSYQSDVLALGEGADIDVATVDEETWLLQLVGTSSVEVEGQRTELQEDDSVLIRAHAVYSHYRPKGCVCLYVQMPWASKTRAWSSTKNANKEFVAKCCGKTEIEPANTKKI
ncbi:3-hydroxyanthranilate 3,4-dioxygenase isoform X2 [Hyalella azteca]|nr:3-hydroxyanthranilate 3,4-dioxygenase isoform X2 [Hyalella azteca]